MTPSLVDEEVLHREMKVVPSPGGESKKVNGDYISVCTIVGSTISRLFFSLLYNMYYISKL